MIRSSAATLMLALFAVSSASAQPPPGAAVGGESSASPVASDEEAVKAAVESFLLAIGSYDLEALPPMFTANANIGVAGFREGQWVAMTYTFDEFHSMLKSRTNPSRYQEHVSQFTVHVERGALAFVRADATLIRDGQARSHNIDYFTLLKDRGVWKFLSASYVATPIVPHLSAP